MVCGTLGVTVTSLGVSCQFGSPGVLQWGAELHPIGARMACYMLHPRVLFSTRSQQVLKKYDQYYLFVFHILHFHIRYVQKLVHSMHV